MRKKLQVFVSSTYVDLREERQAAVEAILASGHIPAGMELFAAGNESQWETIKRWIDESDIYLLILGGRYGSIEPKTQKSYTHLEYEYAIQKGIPVFSIVISDIGLQNKSMAMGTGVIELSNLQKYTQFREVVLGKVCRFFDDCKDIKIAILETLNDFQARYDFVGWISGKDLDIFKSELSKVVELFNKAKTLEYATEIATTTHDNGDSLPRYLDRDICKTDSLPKQLTKSQVEYYMPLMENGDGIAKQKLIEGNLQLVVLVSRKYEGKASAEDLISVGTIGLISAINMYNSKINGDFTEYLYKCIKNEISNYISTYRTNSGHIMQ
jgi:hypothetical protein